MNSLLYFKNKMVKNIILSKDTLKELKSWSKSHGFVKFLIVGLAITYVLVGYNTPIMSWYNTNVIPILNLFVPNFWINSITFILIFIAGCDIYYKNKVCYQFDKYEILALLFLFTELIIYRSSGEYCYVSWIYCISYVDAIWVACVAYFVVAIINKIRKYWELWNKDKNPNSSENDKPIENASQDLYGFTKYVEALVPRIIELDSSNTWSIAINAPWGAGKTSFINLIIEEIGKKADYEIIKFNPRNSKSVNHIQEDFFYTLASALSKYDSRCSHTIKAYMVSLQLIDKSGVINKLVDFYSIWNKEDLKKTIEHTISSLKKKVLVVIDDFDRLTKEEILEVLKLIDKNAAFPNITFLTAYDKAQVNKILNPEYKPDDACFTDKYFYREYSLPLHSLTFPYLINPLDRDLRLSIDEKIRIKNNIAQHISIFEKYITTIRDGKRFIGQFVDNYELVREKVSLPDFLLVQLIKYGDDESYNALRQGEYTEHKSLIPKLLTLKKIALESTISPILKELFPELEDFVDYEKRICNNKRFDIYFNPYADTSQNTSD